VCPSGILPFELSTDERHEQRKESIPDLVKQAAENDVRQVKLGVRLDHYDGLTTEKLVQPRLGVSCAVTRTGTVLRGSYGRTMETALQRDLLLSAGYGLNGLFGASQPLPPGRRNQVELGVKPAHS
jgi:outer membrane receptor protein involved in Fe transport